MELAGRAPALPAIDAGKGRQRQGARHVSQDRHFNTNGEWTFLQCSN
jgi:hypothetical protein